MNPPPSLMQKILRQDCTYRLILLLLLILVFASASCQGLKQRRKTPEAKEPVQHTLVSQNPSSIYIRPVVLLTKASGYKQSVMSYEFVSCKARTADIFHKEKCVPLFYNAKKQPIRIKADTPFPVAHSARDDDSTLAGNNAKGKIFFLDQKLNNQRLIRAQKASAPNQPQGLSASFNGLTDGQKAAPPASSSSLQEYVGVEKLFKLSLNHPNRLKHIETFLTHLYQFSFQKKVLVEVMGVGITPEDEFFLLKKSHLPSEDLALIPGASTKAQVSVASSSSSALAPQHRVMLSPLLATEKRSVSMLSLSHPTKLGIMLGRYLKASELAPSAHYYCPFTEVGASTGSHAGTSMTKNKCFPI